MSFYHFTDPRNIESIRKYGLLSWKRLANRGISHYPGSNTLSRYLDRRDGLEDYIRLCKQPEHPMAFKAKYEGRIKDFVWLEIDESVMYWKSTLFSDKNATSNNAVITSSCSTALNSDSVQAEILIESGLNVRWIKFPF